jgi:SAM-dependent methyltransferase
VDSAQWDERYATSEYQWKMAPNQFVAAQLADLTAGRALDLAAGEGRNSVWLAERGWRVTAVDFSRVGLEKGRKLAASRDVTGIDWVVADLRDYRPAASAFDLVLIAYLHCDASLRAQVLGHAAAALAPGGTLFVVGHDLANLSEGTGGPAGRIARAERAAGGTSEPHRRRRDRDRRTAMGSALASLGRAADPSREQVAQAHHPAYCAALQDWQVTEAVQQHELGGLLHRGVRRRRFRVLRHPGGDRRCGEVGAGRGCPEHIALGQDAGQQPALHHQGRAGLVLNHRGGRGRDRIIGAD